MANEVAVSGKSEAEINAFLDKIAGAMLATVKAGLVDAKEDVLPGPIKLQTKAATSTKRAEDDKYESDRGYRARLRLRPGGFRGERARSPGHHGADGRLGGRDAGARLCPGRRASGSCRRRRSARACWPARPSATCASTTRRSPAPRAAVSPRSASRRPCPPRSSPRSRAASPQVTENAAESALEHHLGMTCDPVAGYVQVPCIERCAFGAVKAWTAFMIATNEIASRHRVDLDTTIKTLAETGQGHEHEVQGNERGGARSEPCPLLKRKRFATNLVTTRHGVVAERRSVESQVEIFFHF